MAGSLNKVILLGRLGKDPEVRSTPDGSKIVNLSIATSESWKDNNTGEKKEKTEWHRAVIFNQAVAEVAQKYLKKGSKLYLEGQLQTRKWTDQQGQERYVTEIVMARYQGNLILLDGKDESTAPSDHNPYRESTYNPGNASSNQSNNQHYANKATSPTSANAPASTPDFGSFISDEIPF